MPGGEAKILPTACVLVDNLEILTNFFSQVFEGTTIESLGAPVRHNVLRISDDAVVIVVAKSLCNSTQLSYFAAISTRQLFISVKDPAKIQRAASSAGAQVSESSFDDSGGDFCVFEGPEGINLHVLSHIRSARLNVVDILMNSSVLYEEDRDETLVAPRQPPSSSRRTPKPKKPYAPSIPTLDVSILSNLSRNYVPCPANSREAIPFETEFFKGIALLVVRTKPPDAQFNSFFEGKK